MYFNDQQTTLQPGDIAIFRAQDKVVQFVRGGVSLLNVFHDDKTSFDRNIVLTEDLCTNIAGVIATVQGFGFENVTDHYKRDGLFYFKFVTTRR